MESKLALNFVASYAALRPEASRTSVVLLQADTDSTRARCATTFMSSRASCSRTNSSVLWRDVIWLRARFPPRAASASGRRCRAGRPRPAPGRLGTTRPALPPHARSARLPGWHSRHVVGHLLRAEQRRPQAALEIPELLERCLEPGDFLAQPIVLPQRLFVAFGRFGRNVVTSLRSKPRIAAAELRLAHVERRDAKLTFDAGQPPRLRRCRQIAAVHGFISLRHVAPQKLRSNTSWLRNQT